MVEAGCWSDDQQTFVKILLRQGGIGKPKGVQNVHKIWYFKIMYW